jgi:fatty acid kinase fatty acid binding subunit
MKFSGKIYKTHFGVYGYYRLEGGMKMTNIGIVTDSTASLEDAYVKEHDIKVVPLKVIMDEVSYREGIDISNNEFYRRLIESDLFPTTSQPSVGEFLDAYKEMAERYDALISIHISAGISGTFESAQSAAAEMGEYPIEVIDSRFTATQLMMFIDEILKGRDQGMGLEDLKSLAEKNISQSQLMFLVDTLEYLHRGGRIGGAQAFMGSMLKIKPILYIDGTIDALEKVRGSGKAVDRLVELLVEKVGNRRIRMGLVHVQASQRMNELADKLKTKLGDRIVSISSSEVGPVVGSHVGPGTIGVGFFPVD